MGGERERVREIANNEIETVVRSQKQRKLQIDSNNKC